MQNFIVMVPRTFLSSRGGLGCIVLQAECSPHLLSPREEQKRPCCPSLLGFITVLLESVPRRLGLGFSSSLAAGAPCPVSCREAAVLIDGARRGHVMDLSPAMLQDHLELGGCFRPSPELCRCSSPAFTRAGTS